MKKVLCKNCECWEPYSESVGGFCRRHAPTPDVMVTSKGREFTLVIPATEKDGGCFEGVEVE